MPAHPFNFTPTAAHTEVLRRAREILTDKRNWCQGCMARNAAGLYVDAASSRAVSFCLLGAIKRACLGDYMLNCAACLILHRTATARGAQALHTNDILGHGAVLALLDAAIKDATELETK